MKEKLCAVYILTNIANAVLYTGVTSNLPKRMYEHKNKFDKKSFTYRYKCVKLVWYETTHDIREAIKREKQIKNWHREWKINMINEKNPEWKDLSLVFTS
jgi:putative endonuclease